MDYNDVPVFVRVVEAGSFTAAAAQLGREKSAVSRSIARLEEELGVRLLQRTTRRLGLTDAGQVFFDRVRGALVGFDEAASSVQELGSEPRGRVRITSLPDSDALSIAAALAEFVKRYPKIHVELLLTGRTVDLVAEGIDLAVRAGRLTDSTLVARRVGSSDSAIFAAPAYLNRRGRPKTPKDLPQHDCVLFRPRGSHATWNLTGPSGEEVVEVTGPLSADDLLFVARAAAAGAGIALLPVLLARDFVARGVLELLLADYQVTGGPIQIVLPSSTFVPTRVAKLRDFLVEHLTRELSEATRECAAHATSRRAEKARETPRARKKR